MPRKSATDNVRKICGCKQWKTCAHPWYVDFKADKYHPRRPSERYRKNLVAIAHQQGRTISTLREAQDEARRAITAWLDCRDARHLQPSDRPTLATVLKTYRQRPNAGAGEAVQVKPIISTVVQGQPLGDWRADAITREVLDAFRRQRPNVAANRNLALLRAMFNWAVADGLLPRTPFRVGNVAVVRLTREEARTRRLQGDEEERLMLAANGLRPLIVGALETGMRLGELLSLQWSQVGVDLFLPAGKTKAKKPRRVPISTALRAVLDARRRDPAGDPLPPDAFVFGDEIGRRRGSVKTAWRFACQRARIEGLHFHDLRREAGSRWMDAGVPLATIQRWLGHHNISQTSKYLAASLGGDVDEMRAFEERIGRVPKPLPQIDISGGSNGSDPTRTDRTMLEKTQQNVFEHEPTGAVH